MIDACRDDFDLDRPAGTVLGSRASSGAERLGVDAEGTMAIDNGALRIEFLERPGWGREAIAYGPFARQAGRAMSALVLNGHHASEVHVSPVHGRRAKLRGLARSLGRRGWPLPRLSENLAVGWSGEPAARPGGPALVIRHAGPENADLCAAVAGRLAPLLRCVRDVPIIYVAQLRERGALYLAASVADVPGLPAHPQLRPLAIEPEGTGPALFATVHQSVLGEAGWRVDTRVEGVRVERVAELGSWYGSAHAADPLSGSGPLEGSPAQAGGAWAVLDGAFERSGEHTGGHGTALLSCPAPTGLVHVELAAARAGTGIVWRADGRGNGLSVTLERGGARLALAQAGVEQELARDSGGSPRSGRSSLQALDDGEEITVLVDGRVLFGGPVREKRMAASTGAGIKAGAGGEPSFAYFEAHPRTIALPPSLDPGSPWDRRGGKEVISDDFQGPPGELADPWSRRFGDGTLDRSGDGGARVRADRDNPNPGRTIYALPWAEPSFAELAIDQTPPGSGPGEGEKGRCGLVFIQDLDNYLLVNTWLDDDFDGTAVSAFLRLGGEEDHFRAVWANIGRTIRWGDRSRLSIACDGMRWTARVDGQPVLHRALTDVYADARPLRIDEVGIAVNWEYGDDTGTLIHRFTACGPGA